MDVVWFFLTALVARFLGIFPMCNIVGSIQQRRYRGIKMTLITITIHTVIVIGLGAVVGLFLGSSLLWAYIIGMALALLKALTSGPIQ